VTTPNSSTTDYTPIAERQRCLIEDYSIIEDSTERFAAIIDRGKSLPAVPDEERVDANLVEGCTSQVWLTGALNEAGRCEFHIEADSSIVQGMAALLATLYSDAEIGEILSIEPDVIPVLKIDHHLSPTRLNGTRQILNRMRAIVASLASESS
jgi:cysteine desulfuration protein SufE